MESKVLKIGQITDIHIGDDDGLVQGIDVRANFMKALHSDSMKDIDLLVLSGDLANENAEPGAYKFIAEKIKEFGKPYCIIPGNHDRIEVMQEFYDLKVINGKCYYRYDMAGRSIFFLDSSDGSISSEQLEWFEKETSQVQGEILLFIHHPPCFCGHRFMDLKYHMTNMLDVQKVLARIGNLKNIFVGHYHSQFEVKLDKQMVYVTPSTQMQIDPHTPYFTLQSAAPGWRTINWGEDFLETFVHFE